jgi:tyrosine aminotransferase
VGENLLVPAPGFPLYQVIAEANGSFVKEYPLIPSKGWEMDIDALEALIDDKTRGIVINNPSNPCGSLFSDDNLLKLLAVAEKHKLIVIADEVSWCLGVLLLLLLLLLCNEVYIICSTKLNIQVMCQPN